MLPNMLIWANALVKKYDVLLMILLKSSFSSEKMSHSKLCYD